MAPDPTNKNNWPALGFALYNTAGTLLVALPPPVAISGPIGQADPYTWERAPGSNNWYPLGDGLPKEPPRLVLSGAWEYTTVAEARQDIVAIRAALNSAAEVRWLGGWIANLRRDVPGHHTYTTGEVYTQVTHSLTLNLTAPLSL